MAVQTNMSLGLPAKVCREMDAQWLLPGKLFHVRGRNVSACHSLTRNADVGLRLRG